jgi:2-dehydro-3-deoxyphosphogluconate aldolase/(4S)-4-hydroxy-2-oxoglutarate aldolase
MIESSLFPIKVVLAISPVIPVVVLEDRSLAVPLAQALLAGGIRVMEVTLRTPAALDCIRAIRAEVPNMLVGAGTITREADLFGAERAGAQFGVCPGAPTALLSALRDASIPFLPGAMTPTEVMTLRDAGFPAVKLFPAQQAGGFGMLSALGSVFPDIQLCPTGGVDAASAAQYLALPNVPCVGGSWLTPAARVAAGDWPGITMLAQAAAALARSTNHPAIQATFG